MTGRWTKADPERKDEANQARQQKNSVSTDSVQGETEIGNGLSAAQSEILAMQRIHGNAAVRRVLSQRASTVQRDPPAPSPVSGGSGSVLDQYTPSILRPNYAALQQVIQQSN